MIPKKSDHHSRQPGWRACLPLGRLKAFRGPFEGRRTSPEGCPWRRRFEPSPQLDPHCPRSLNTYPGAPKPVSAANQLSPSPRQPPVVALPLRAANRIATTRSRAGTGACPYRNPNRYPRPTRPTTHPEHQRCHRSRSRRRIEHCQPESAIERIARSIPVRATLPSYRFGGAHGEWDSRRLERGLDLAGTRVQSRHHWARSPSEDPCGPEIA